MWTLAVAVVITWAVGFIAPAHQDSAPPASTGWECAAPPIEPCFQHRGRLSSQNGIAYRLWLIGTKRMLAISNTKMPEILDPYLSMTSPLHGYIYGDFEVCPLGPDRPGHARDACIKGATRLVVQDHARTQGPIRLLSTWPKAQR